eukprot:TRINITY_DN6872_c0_g1_i1.p1 TRINITY_DN6872_c0_g1~~TRINITY_DN6872_c0_g1_i1.p1  ORF type:complete len:479 (+),score=84.36 TRINITY_DN6872_c0_g1_i1:41-1438(+)
MGLIMMTKFIFFGLFLALALGLKPSMKNALRNQVIVDFKNAIAPIISKKVSHLVLPDVHASKFGISIDITNVYIDVAPFSGNQIGVVFVPGTSILRFSARGFAMNGHAHIRAKWAFITKSFDADIGVRNLGFDCQTSLLSVNQKPNIKVDSLAIHLSGGDVSIHFHGGIVEKILEFVADLLKGHFVSQIVGQLQSKLPPEITSKVNEILNKLPTDIDVGQGLSMKYGFPYAPYVKQDYLFTGITAYIHVKGNPTPPPYEPADIPEFDAANPKGIQFFVSDYIVKSSLDASFAIGMMKVSFEKDVMGHHIKMACKADKVPSFAFINAIDVTVSAQCDVLLDNDPKTKFTLIIELHVNLKEYIKQAVIFFSIGEVKITKIEYKQENPVDIEWFKNGINTILEVITAIVNSELGQKGIPLPVIPGIDYTDTVQFVRAGYLEICTTPVFHFTMTEDEQSFYSSHYSLYF